MFIKLLVTVYLPPGPSLAPSLSVSTHTHHELPWNVRDSLRIGILIIRKVHTDRFELGESDKFLSEAIENTTIVIVVNGDLVECERTEKDMKINSKKSRSARERAGRGPQGEITRKEEKITSRCWRPLSLSKVTMESSSTTQSAILRTLRLGKHDAISLTPKRFMGRD